MRKWWIVFLLCLPAQAQRETQRNYKQPTEQRAVAEEPEEAEEVTEMAAADSVWNSVDGNMSTAASWSPSGVPITLASLFFNNMSQADVSSGLTAFSLFDINKIWVQSPYSGNIGAIGNALFVQCKHLIHNGSGSLYHHVGLHTSPMYVVIDSPNMQDAYTLTDTDGAVGVSLTLAIKRGLARIPSSSGGGTVIGSLFVGGDGGSDPVVEIGRTDGNLLYRQTNGYVTTGTALGSYGSTGRAIIDGGTLVYNADGKTAVAWVNVEVTGGRFEYNGLATMTSCIVSSGALDMTKDSRAKTITKLTLLPGSNFLTHNNITVTTLIDLRPKYPILP